MSAFGIDIAPEAVCIYASGVTKHDALDRLVEAITQTGVISDVEAFRQAVHEREVVMSTGIGAGVAIPHVRIPEVLKPAIGVGLAPEGIEFDTLDDAPVRLVVLFAMPSGAHKEYLGLLAQVMVTLKTPGFRDSLLACKTPEEAIAIINAK